VPFDLSKVLFIATANLMDPVPDNDRFLQGLAGELDQRFRIDHATIQLEHGEEGVDCRQSLSCAH